MPASGQFGPGSGHKQKPKGTEALQKNPTVLEKYKYIDMVKK